MAEDIENSDDSLEGSPTSCFVIGPIGDREASHNSPERQIYEEAIQVWEDVILPACEAFGVRPIRADHIATTGEIPEQVFRRLRDSQLVIADLTGANPNVMYELGLRHTTGKLTIQIGERARLPFDVSAIRTIIFRRTEAGLIEARKKLAQAISEGLQRGGDPVSATRVWFEHPLITNSVAASPEDSILQEDEELGVLEKLANMLEGMGSLAKIAETVGAIISTEINQPVHEASEQSERINNLGGSPGAKLEVTNRLAKKLDGPATRLEVLAGEYSQSIERTHPGVVHLLGLIRENPQAREDAGEFPQQIMSLIRAVEESTPQIEGFRMSLAQSGEMTRELRRVNRRIAASMKMMIDANARMREWKMLLGGEDAPNTGAAQDG